VAEAHPITVKGEVRIEEPTAAQRTVARRTAEARATVPHVEMSNEAEMSASLQRREREGVGLTSLLVRACALALREEPYANGAYRDGRFELYSRINVGVVVAAGDTYAVPTVFDADQKTPAELTAEIDELRRGALERTLPSPAFSGATFTVWNAGAHGLNSASPMINPPQSGAIAFGLIRSVPAVQDGALIEHRPMTITLGCDHRILYGDRAARFLAGLKSRLEQVTL
jgi:pyruvate dehydrogenase E2 component (dihydrolipoyllysine-residue acetyltransferase)